MEQKSVEAWLKGIDLLQYSDLFCKAGVCDLDQCRNLNAQRLTQIGITLMGHRKRILDHLPEDFYVIPPPIHRDCEEPPILPPKTVVVTISKQESLSTNQRPVPKPRRTIKKQESFDEPEKGDSFEKMSLNRPIPRPRSRQKSNSQKSTSQSDSTDSSTLPVSPVFEVPDAAETHAAGNYSLPVQIIVGSVLDRSSDNDQIVFGDQKPADNTVGNLFIFSNTFGEETLNSSMSTKAVDTPMNTEPREEEIYESIWIENKPKSGNKSFSAANDLLSGDAKPFDSSHEVIKWQTDVSFSPRPENENSKTQMPVPVNSFPVFSTCANDVGISSTTYSNPLNPFCLPPPTFPPPPLPAVPDIQDLKEFDPLASPISPPVPPRPPQLDEFISVTSRSRALKTNATPQKDNTSQSRSFYRSSFPSHYTPNNKNPFADDSFDISNNVHSPNTHPVMKNIPSIAGEDPFINEQDPFSDFARECKNFNKEFNVAQPIDSQMYVNVGEMTKKNDEDFDFFGLKPENVSQSPAKQSQEYRWSLSQVPPPMCQPDENTSFMYEVANVPLGDTSSYEGSSTDDDLVVSGTICSIDIKHTDISARKHEQFGYLWKQGGVKANMGWRKRWVVFNGSDLRYFANSKAQVSKRIVPLSCMMEVVNDVKDGHTTQFKFRLITKNRTFLFASNNRDDCFMWCNRLMEAIIGYKEPEGGMKPGGEMWNADKEGLIRFDGRRSPYFVVIKGGKLCYYNTEQDFKIASPVHEIEMKLASVKSLTSIKLQLSTHYGFFHLTFEKPHDANQWKLAIEEAIADGLGDNTILDQVMENPSNQHCGDCSAAGSHWAAIDKGLVLCKQCAGIHRDSNANRVKSLRMDTRIWTPSLIEMMKLIGNKNANDFWCGNLPAADQISVSTEANNRKQYIENKYLRKKFCRLHPLASDKKKMNELLVQTVNTDDILLTMKLVFSGANVLYSRTGSQDGTALSIAKHASRHVQVEFLYQNGGDRLIGGLSGADEALYNRRRYEVCKRGYLLKTGSNMKDFLNRYCVLEHASLSYYSTDSSNIAKDSLDCEIMLFLQSKPQDRFEHAFELSTSRNNNRIYFFAAQSAVEKVSWMQALSKVFCPVDIMDKVGTMDFSLSGICFYKDGLMMEWQKSWLMLNDRELMVFDKDMNLNTVDLRKATRVKYHETQTSCQLCIEKTGRLFIVDVPGSALYLQADLIRDTDRMYRIINDAVKRSGPTLEDQQLTAEDVPVIICKCIEFVELYGVKEEGIYRKAGTESQIRSLLEKFRTDAGGVVLKEGEAFVHDVANVLKRFLRELKEPIVTREQHPQWLQTAAMRDSHFKYRKYRYLLDKPGFPKVNYLTMKKLAKHLHLLTTHSAENKMVMENIALAFGPSLLGQNDVGTASLTQEIWVIRDIVEYREKLFETELIAASAEALIADKITKAKDKINQLKHKSIACNSVITGIQFRGECEYVQQIHNETTVSDVIEAMKEKFKLQARGWALHEIVKSGAIERPLHPSEKVMKVIGEWGLWGDEYRTKVCLCLKPDEMLRRFQEAYNPGKALFTEMDYRDKKKKTKKLTFGFKQAKLSFYKNKKVSSPIESWNVEDIKVYIGADHDKHPTKWAFSFLANGDRVGTDDMPGFGSSVWCSSQDEQLAWLSAMFKAQHSDWLS